jgi:dephospho-CoA kinase
VVVRETWLVIPQCGRRRLGSGAEPPGNVTRVILVGLTGGIGSGKSTVAARLAARGAIIVDADAIVHEVQQPGSPVVAELVERFGPEILTAEGALDRPVVAAKVFSDPDALAALNAIVHPAVGREMNRRVLEHRDSDHIVVLDIPLLTERPRPGLQGIIVVDVPVETQLERLLRYRGFDETDARARIARQASREERLATASMVVDNSGPPEALEVHIDAAWAWLTSLPQLSPHEVGDMSGASRD